MVPCGGLSALRVIRAGLVPYERGLAAAARAARRGRRRHAARHRPAARAPAGLHRRRRTEVWERPTDGTPVIDVDRGGKITWHGPGQLVGYPIVQLADPIDVVAYVRAHGAGADRRLRRARRDRGAGSRDAAASWLPPTTRGPERKVAAIGIRVAQRRDAARLRDQLRPRPVAGSTASSRAASRDAGVTSLSAELGRDVTVAEVLPVVERHLPALLDDATLGRLSQWPTCRRRREHSQPARPAPAADPAGRADRASGSAVWPPASTAILGVGRAATAVHRATRVGLPPAGHRRRRLVVVVAVVAVVTAVTVLTHERAPPARRCVDRAGRPRRPRCCASSPPADCSSTA